jgi:hypothetical protein
MRDISRRIEKAESKLNVNRESITINVTCYGWGLPPDHKRGGITIHHVMYESIENNECREQD